MEWPMSYINGTTQTRMVFPGIFAITVSFGVIDMLGLENYQQWSSVVDLVRFTGR
jgi:hypothetical protein